MWLPVVIFVALVLVVAVATEWRERRRKKNGTAQTPAAPTPENKRPEGCCGEHLVCEKETLLNTGSRIVYYDDEELDALSGVPAADYTAAQYEALREVFSTLREEDVAGWCRSLQMRGIELPQDIREEALLIVKERRNK